LGKRWVNEGVGSRKLESGGVEEIGKMAVKE
jgi:hypothetical protein